MFYMLLVLIIILVPTETVSYTISIPLRPIFRYKTAPIIATITAAISGICQKRSEG
ncbi:MAG: hypothetical protein ACTSWY_14350 [Promethearchaeota archaeon]